VRGRERERERDSERERDRDGDGGAERHKRKLKSFNETAYFWPWLKDFGHSSPFPKSFLRGS